LYGRMAFENDAAAVQKATEQWAKDGTGQLAEHNVSLAVMFNKVPSLYQTPEFTQLSPVEQEYLLRDTVPTYEATFGGPKFPPSVEVPLGHEYLGITVFGMNPQGAGTVKLASANPADKAIVDPRTLVHPFDSRVMFDSLIDVLNFFKGTNIYKKYFVNWLAGPETYEDKDIQKFLEEQIILVWHANGTVKMGRKDDKGTCVDSDFKVLGIERLRVADMSVSPVTIN
jgi:hypothetical protein